HRGHHRSDWHREWPHPDAGSVPLREPRHIAAGSHHGCVPRLRQRTGVLRDAAAGAPSRPTEPGRRSGAMLIPSLMMAVAAALLLLVLTRKLRAAGAWWAALAGQRTEDELA